LSADEKAGLQQKLGRNRLPEGALAQVKNVMATAGLSESRRKILQAISGFEGGFDTVNTYDRAKITWGFVQWTGGSHSDLTRTLTIIKEQHPEAFANSFQAYGIDVVKDELVITPPDGTPALKGEAAANAIMKNPRLSAVMAHAGRNNEIQKGEVQAASELEIEHALGQQVQFGEGKNKITTTAGALVTSEYGVGVLANTFVHSGSGAARVTVHAAVVGYLAKHPYIAGDEAWRAGAEEAIVAALGAKDSDRAASLRKQLAKYQDVELLLQIGEYKRGSDAEADEAIRNITAIRKLLQQPSDQLSGFDESVAALSGIGK